MRPFHRVARLSDLPPAGGRAFDVAGTAVALFRAGGRVLAIADACPHMGASLADGRLEDGVLACSWHGWRFDASSGRGLPPARPWACARVFEVKVEGGDVYVRLPEPEAGTEREDDDPSYWDAERWFRKPRG